MIVDLIKRVIPTICNNSDCKLIPSTLYKYYRFDTSYNEKRLSGQIFLSNPLSFNDPYDLRYGSCILGINVDDLDSYPEIKEGLDKLFSLDMKDIIEDIETQRKIIVPENTKEKYKEFVKTRAQSIR